VSDTNSPLILLPGMGADARMFAALRADLPQIVTPPWIEPARRESLILYARRLATTIDPGQPCYVGGASFGGVVALEMAAALHARACFLIGSVRSSQARPWQLALLRPMTPFIGVLPRMSPAVVRWIGQWIRPATRGVLMQLGDTDARFLRWAAHAILTWTPSPEVAHVRVCHIHGECDRVFPSRLAQADELVTGAGHLVSITHPTAVSEFLRGRIAEIERAAFSTESGRIPPASNH
jgi:pimeloyl-ACP methyl ester carboxylesterase